MKHLDKHGKEISCGDIIDLHQTVNGENLFVILNTNPLDIRYRHDLLREYEYDKIDLLSPSKFTGETEWEIVNNIYNYLHYKITYQKDYQIKQL